MAKSRKPLFLERARRGALEVKNFTPVTGIGKFDAKLDPFGHRLDITLKVFFIWKNEDAARPWTAAEQVEYKAALKKVVEATWSDCYTFASDKEDWRELWARVFVTIETVTSAATAHYSIEVNKIAEGSSFRSGIDRANWKGCFTQNDVVAETKMVRDHNALVFLQKQFADKLASARCEYIAFPADSATLPQSGALALNGFANAVRSLVTPQLADSEFRIYCYGKAGSGESKLKNLTTGKSRAKAVASYLGQRLGQPALVEVVESFESESWMRQDLDRILRAAGVNDRDRQSRAFPGVVLLTKDLAIATFADGASRGIQRNYVVVAHEFGHMFGLPDEYMGVNCLGLEQEVDLRTVVPAMYQQMAKLRPAPDPNLKEQAEGFASLLRSGNVPSPVFMNSTSVVTTSLMYAGSDVLPAHYLTFLEALLTICYPYFWPGEWKIVPNGADASKKSNLALFAQ